MRNVIKNILAATVAVLLLICTAFACGATEKTAPKRAVYVAGQYNFYPVEFFNEQNHRYEGILPEILQETAEENGWEIIFIQREESVAEMAENGEVDIISSYVTDTGRTFVKDFVTVLSYNQQGKTVNIGYGFPKTADSDIKKAIERKVSSIDDEELHGYLVSARFEKPNDKTGFFIMSVFSVILLLLILMFVIIRNRQTAKEIEKNKLLDTETGIGNLGYLEKEFRNRITNENRQKYYMAYILIDSNYLQSYYGSVAFADAVRYMVNRLMSYASGSNIAARLTESGFGYIFRAEDRQEAVCHMEELMKRLNIFAEEEEEERKKKIGCAFYASVYQLMQEDVNCENLLFNLRRNCNKLVGKGRELVFCDAMQMNSASEEKALLESFRKGFSEKEFKLYLQFIVDNKTKQIVSAEALSRWKQPGAELKMPGAYIGDMERVGVISDLDYYMFEMVCRQLHKWHGTPLGGIAVSCNITRITLSEETCAEKLKSIAEGYIFDRSKLILEITEDAIEKDKDVATRNVLDCKKHGFSIALDDLGSGYTALSSLCDYPIDIAKIDRDILLNTKSKSGKDLLLGIVALAHSLNLKVVCEGVETEEQNRFVSETDCDYIQGWYYFKAQKAEDCELFIEDYQKRLTEK